VCVCASIYQVNRHDFSSLASPIHACMPNGGKVREIYRHIFISGVAHVGPKCVCVQESLQNKHDERRDNKFSMIKQ
jgi:hypothetical protein